MLKLEIRKDMPNSNATSYIKYVEISVYGTQYRLIKFTNPNQVFLVNGTTRAPPYTDSFGVTVTNVGNTLVITTQFGLSVSWDGDHKFNPILCDAYAGYICGLCGNGLGIIYVDRNNVPVPLTGNKYTSYFTWGSKWRVSDPENNLRMYVYIENKS
jgi:hypothetical protein